MFNYPNYDNNYDNQSVSSMDSNYSTYSIANATPEYLKEKVKALRRQIKAKDHLIKDLLNQSNSSLRSNSNGQQYAPKERNFILKFIFGLLSLLKGPILLCYNIITLLIFVFSFIQLYAYEAKEKNKWGNRILSYVIGVQPSENKKDIHFRLGLSGFIIIISFLSNCGFTFAKYIRGILYIIFGYGAVGFYGALVGLLAAFLIIFG